MTVLKTLKRNALVSIALGALVITSFGTGNAEALFENAKRKLTTAGHRLNCKAKCNKAVVRGNEKKLNDCASSCDVAAIINLLIPDCAKLNPENLGTLEQVLRFKKATDEKDQRVIAIEMEHLSTSDAAATKSMMTERQKKIEDLLRRNDELAKSINDLSETMVKCGLSTADAKAHALRIEEAKAELSGEANGQGTAFMPTPDSGQEAFMAKSEDKPVTHTSAPTLPTEPIRPSKELPSIPVKQEPKGEAEKEEQPEPGSLAAQLRAQKLKKAQTNDKSAPVIERASGPAEAMQAPALPSRNSDEYIQKRDNLGASKPAAVVASKPAAVVASKPGAEETPKPAGGLLAEIQAGKKLKKMDPNAPRPGDKALPPVQKTKEEAMKEALANTLANRRRSINPVEE